MCGIMWKFTPWKTAGSKDFNVFHISQIRQMN